MSAILKIPLNGGYVSTGADARSADDLESGELTSMRGAFYRKNDRGMAWKMPGRSEFGSAGSGGVKGIAICQFDEGGTDYLVASIGTTLVAATPGATGTFASLATGLNSSATVLTAAQQEDRWFLGNGYDDNRVLMPDGTVRLMGMKTPTEAPTATATTVSQVIFRPTANAWGFHGDAGASIPSTNPAIGIAFANPGNAYDSDQNTFASGTPHAPPSGSVFVAFQFSTVIYSGIPTSGGAADRKVRILWGADILAGSTNIRFYVSENSGNSYSEAYNVYYAYPEVIEPNWVEVPITAENTSVTVECFIECSVGSHGSSLRVYDVMVQAGSAASVTTTLGGIRYAITEYNSYDKLESPPSERTAPLALAAGGQANVVRPTLINSAATHWRVYRIGDGVTNTLDNLGLVSGDILASDTTWVDTFEVAVTEQATPIVPLLTVGELSLARDTPPPAMFSMISWKGSICGISRSSPRAWYYSELGFPESFPAFYVVTNFPLDDHDTLVGQMAVGETLVLLCNGAVLALDDVPRVTDGVYNSASARPIKGHPGCVGTYAFTTFSVAGEPRGAWVSPFGVYITNGQTCACISTDLCWEREVNVPYLGTSVLRWDAKNVILWFQFDKDGDGLNDHEMAFHMAEAHSKGESKPKLSQPTAKATSCMASALIDSTHYRFSGHPSDGSVYVEESGTVDEATGSEVEMTVRSGQVGREMINLGVIKATLSHSDFGTGETGTFTATLYRDSSNSENSREQEIRLDGHRGTTIGVGRAGDLVDVEIAYSGPGTGGLGDVSLEVEGHGRSGSAPRVTSSSATP